MVTLSSEKPGAGGDALGRSCRASAACSSDERDLLRRGQQPSGGLALPALLPPRHVGGLAHRDALEAGARVQPLGAVVVGAHLEEERALLPRAAERLAFADELGADARAAAGRRGRTG